MGQWFWKHRVIAAIAAICAFLNGVSGLWALVSEKPLAKWIREQEWILGLSPVWIVICVSFAFLFVILCLLFAGSRVLPLRIRAWPVDNEDNLTTLARVGIGKAPTDMVCFVGITNPNQNQGLKPVSFHLISISPRLSGSKAFHPATQNHKLRAIRFQFTNIPGDALNAGIEALVRVFTATRYFRGTEEPKTVVKFGGEHAEPFNNEFIVPEGAHIMVTDASASGVSKTRAYFKIEFHSGLAKPVFSLKRRLLGFGKFGVWKRVRVD